jgi:hypothetical protein
MAPDALPFEDDDTASTRRRRTGPARAAVERSLTAWRKAGHMVGPEWAAAVRVLKDSADAVDAAARALDPPRCPSCRSLVPDAHQGSPYTLANANNVHAQLVAAAQPKDTDGDDDTFGDADDDALARAVAAAFGDGAPAAPPGDAAGHDVD